MFTRKACLAALALPFDFSYSIGRASASGSFLSDAIIRKDQVQTVLEHKVAKDAACKHIPTGPIETTLCDYESIESVNEDLFHNLKELVHTPFFKYFQVDLYRECPFWEDYGACMNRDCGITTVDESEIPERWRAAALSKIEASTLEGRNTLPGCYYRDSDFCFLDDNTEGDYVDLTLIPEYYTGYNGEKAHRVWRSIYEENCFGLTEYDVISGRSNAPLPDTMNEHLGEGDEQCLEKRVYYKIISGECLKAYDYCALGDHEEDADTLAKVAKVVAIASDVGKFDEKALFRGENANMLKEEFKDHFRNVSRIMDCVGCDKCRLWGKVQTTGLATALKILFELDEKALDPKSNANLLQRSEVVALINTLHRFSESLEAVNDFRQMWAHTDSSDTEKLISEAEGIFSQPARPKASPIAGAPSETNNSIGDIRSRVETWLEVCKESTLHCIDLLRDVWDQALSTLASVFSSSQKAGGLYREL
ncbi:hypothetical protein HWV62_31473 [Athelia sp. TMB]|nr:hypothetical protein HWV62_31473 [Athelia sp. TMB]